MKTTTTLAAAAAALILTGCQSNYSADLRNQTPQPVFAQILEASRDGAFNRAAVRLGPGDRAGIGPVRMRTGRAVLVVDTKPNPRAPSQIEMHPGTMFLEIRPMSGDLRAPFEIREVR